MATEQHLGRIDLYLRNCLEIDRIQTTEKLEIQQLLRYL